MAKVYTNDFRIYRGKHEKFDVIGDIHGCYKELTELVEKLGYTKYDNCYRHPDGRRLVSVGDIGDKGRENLKCISFWLDQVEFGGAMWVYGNHCNKFFRYLLGNHVRLSHGLENTVEELLSLPANEREAFSARYMDIYKKQSHYILFEKAGFLVVHGGIKKENIGRFNNKIRTVCLYGDTTGEFDEFGKPVRRDWAKKYDGEIFIIYGHTAKEKAEIINNTIDIDQGCVYGGKLTALRMPEREVIQVEGYPYAEMAGGGFWGVKR